MTNAQASTINWDRAIARNRDALLRILAALFAMAGLGEREPVTTLPRHLHNHILRILRAAESAVRRLVVIAARDLVVVVAPARHKQATTTSTTSTTTTTTTSKPPRSVILGLDPRTHSVKPAVQARTFSLPLLDPRKRFEFRPRRRRAKSFPRICVIGVSEPRPIPDNWLPSPDDEIDAAPLCRRLAGLKRALDNLDGHARRLARWKARRDLGLNRTRRFHPMRPGRPPGHRKRPVHEIDDILRECHALAHDAQRDDTS
ncbi:hypothetical protein [Oricola nitratireducens]|uniref:hypothetical protein n=1 Tax=Oricola nitratireducens TaxID=2775868 RepID=UPI001AEE92F7|nr:hypothetical protein [Oricola nitratireducens]